MSTSSGDPVPAALVERVKARLAEEAQSKPSATKAAAYGGDVLAAAVMGWFDPGTLRPLAGGPAPGTEDDLLARSLPTVDSLGARRWALGPKVRTAALRELRESGRVDEALAANPDHPGDPVGTALRGYLAGEAKPLAEQSMPELECIYQVSE